MDPFSWLIGGAMIGGSLLSGAGGILGGESKANARIAEGEARATGTLFAAEAGVQGAEFKAQALEQGGLFAEQQGDFEAGQLRASAAETRAVAQREAFEKRRAGKLAMSTLIARAAASGGGATDRTVLRVGEQIADRSEYMALADMFTGESRARGLEDQATATKMSAAAKRYGMGVDAIAARYGARVGMESAIFEAGSLRSGAAIGSQGDRLQGWLGGTGAILSGIGSAAGRGARYGSPYG